MTLPKTIFKYEPFALRAIQNLKASSIYFASPLTFNDPYDCALTASIDDMSPTDLEELRSEWLASNDFPDIARHAVSSLSLADLEAQVRRGALSALHGLRETFLRQKGVTCFSETNDNLLMWSHYGGRYKGYCLEFRTDFQPFSKLRKVRYSAEMPAFHVRDFRNADSDRVMELFCTKSLDWAYEKEWRALHQKAGTMFSYEREALKAIYFGPDIDEQDRDLLCNILFCQYEGAELWTGKRSATSFRVEFERISSYLPYAEARRRGLTDQPKG